MTLSCSLLRFFDAFIQNDVGFRDDTSLSCDTTLFRMVADIEQKLNKILDENETPFPMIPICVTVNNKKFLVELYKGRKVAVPEGELKWASFEHDPFSNGEPVEENCLFTSGLFADIKMCFNSAFEIEHIFVVVCSFYNIDGSSQYRHTQFTPILHNPLIHWVILKRTGFYLEGHCNLLMVNHVSL